MSGIRILCDTNVLTHLLNNNTDVIEFLNGKRSRKHKLKVPDVIIAASALYSDIPLVTFDNDFSDIEELNLVLLKL